MFFFKVISANIMGIYVFQNMVRITRIMYFSFGYVLLF